MVPGLLDTVVPGLDRYQDGHYPHDRIPGTPLLGISVRVTFLAGVGAARWRSGLTITAR